MYWNTICPASHKNVFISSENFSDLSAVDLIDVNNIRRPRFSFRVSGIRISPFNYSYIKNRFEG